MPWVDVEGLSNLSTQKDIFCLIAGGSEWNDSARQIAAVL